MLVPLWLVVFMAATSHFQKRALCTALSVGQFRSFRSITVPSSSSCSSSKIYYSSHENKIGTDDVSNDDSSNTVPQTPWNDPRLTDRAAKVDGFRSRQHVNPLSRKFQQHTILPDTWPRDVFDDLSRPLFLDIGCSRGGFLLDMARRYPNDYNYLGLEIRPIIVYHAKSRVSKHGLQGRLDFVGCNANVDLERILRRVSDARQEDGSDKGDSVCGQLQMVTIQFPDPHFKSRHAKRRVVNVELIHTLAQFMPAGATVFLQSDVQPVLDEMRSTFREYGHDLFTDTLESTDEYVKGNIFDVPTERETSVLERGLDVYRAVFARTDQPLLQGDNQ
jgi:tRNA (guanine-N7-)-methyltransferase